MEYIENGELFEYIVKKKKYFLADLELIRKRLVNFFSKL